MRALPRPHPLITLPLQGSGTPTLSDRWGTAAWEEPTVWHHHCRILGATQPQQGCWVAGATSAV